ncbi:hypothetical protein CONCODRAFT_78938 [Conidiobolus coronatus NRRL 28638]|uniref:F-box domain-containing protein n=1 Tax=Conidiobolus coronatus (strain ATCC 28846 / CBS 209.66 / NRRL 28638) TaxID=796925 RepID=A0A137P5Q5_CONC2|nr:hypothetical protein CONCODRAFT_78938 [Conidiobolus coronatus NRRL 28638]|eukprot:KXN70264.1 hypothetical protein CONCODRAFT_78938 [Conidiobolus coronatus NRRL 28638]
MVFNKLEFKDLINLNTVNKQWNELINPICKESLRITRPMYVVKGYHPIEIPGSSKLDLEVRECISNNEKYSKLITKFKWNTHIPTNLTIEFFSKFSNLTYLFINKMRLSQDIILAAIQPLKKLSVLSFKDVNIKAIFKNRIFKNRITLPHTLKKIEFEHVRLTGNTELFTDSINSHSNIEEVVFDSYSNINLIDSLKKFYPTLNTLKITSKYSYINLDSLLKIIEFNPQLKSLEIHSSKVNRALLDSISNNLIDLEELVIRHTTRIRIIKDFDFSFNFQKLKKLTIYYASLNLKSFEKLLINSVNLKELHIALSETNWKGQLGLISNSCSSLTHLTIHIPRGDYNHERGTMPLVDSDEFLEELQLSGRKFKNTLKSLSLSNVALFKLDPIHFSIFPELTVINLRCYSSQHDNVTLKNARDHFKEFDGFILRRFKNKWGNECYLSKAGNLLNSLDWSDYYYW